MKKNLIFSCLFLCLSASYANSSICYGKFYHHNSPSEPEIYCALNINNQQCQALVSRYAQIFKKHDPGYYFVQYSWSNQQSTWVYCTPFPTHK